MTIAGDAVARQPRPVAPVVDADGIPDRLKQTPHWVCWRYEWKPPKGKSEGKWDKPPYNAATGKLASSTDPQTWAPFDVALAAYHSGTYDGIGFVCHKQVDACEAHGAGDIACPHADDVVLLDLDDCRDEATGELQQWAAAIVAEFGSYVEASPSGQGVRGVAVGRKPAGHCRKGDFELYDSARYCTMTGRRLPGAPAQITDRQNAIDSIHRKIFPPQPAKTPRPPSAAIGPDDAELVGRAMQAKDGTLFQLLWSGSWEAAGKYPSQSEADLALCGILAFWTQGDACRIDALFRQSGLMRGKWEREDYRSRTIDKALSGKTEFYNPGPRLELPREWHSSTNGAAPPNGQAPHGTIFSNFQQNGDDGPAVGLSAAAIARRLRDLAGTWPKRVGQPPQLFVPSADFRPELLTSADELFAWIGRKAQAKAHGDHENAVRWKDRGADKVSRSHFAAHLRQTADHFDSIEPAPHYPPMPRCYYLHPEIKTSEGGVAFEALLGRFAPAHDCVDYDLIKALFLTLFWGGAPGQRPAFLIEAEDEDRKGGRGVGKTKLAMAAAHLAGGHISARPNEPFDKLTTRLLSPAALDRRVVLLDNVKELRFSWADLEAIITENVISGHGLYVGEARRPNNLIWLITMNGASMSRDLAQRSVPIRLRRPPHNPAWEAETWELIETHRWEIIGDIIEELRRPAPKLTRYSRWSAWEQAVLSRVADPSECQKVIEERQAAVDDEAAEADLVRDAFAARIREEGHVEPAKVAVWIPANEAAGIVNLATGERFAVNKATKYLNTLAIQELRRSPRVGKRGWAWRGLESDPTAHLQELRQTAQDDSQRTFFDP